MSWVQWLGETWETTDDEAEIHLHLWQPQAMCPRQSWSLSLHHYDRKKVEPKGGRKFDRWIDMEVTNLGFQGSDWRDFSGMEIRGDAAWHAAQEHFKEYGRLDSAEVRLRATYLGNSPGNPSPIGEGEGWIGHDFILRLGKRDGLAFPCELDAWLLPEEEFYRTVPETPAELARFGEGPPDLRVISRAVFTRGTVEVPRTDDPLPLARRFLREEVALEEIHDPKIEWALRRSADFKGSEPMPGWTSRVTFQTQPKR